MQENITIKTTIEFFIGIDEFDDIQSLIDKIIILKDYLIEFSSYWEFEYLIKNKKVEGEAIGIHFDELIRFIKLNTLITTDEIIFKTNSYLSDDFPDLESNEIRFLESFIITSDNVLKVFANTPNYYSSELDLFRKQLSYRGIDANINDINNDYVECYN